MNRDKVYASRALAGRIKRYSTWPMLHQQTVGEHSARVANLFVEIFGMPRPEVLYYCLNHDAGELWAGDLPFGVKQHVPGLKEAMRVAEAIGLKKLDIMLPDLTELECAQVKVCDLLEMFECGIIEMNMGNKYAEPIKHDTMYAAQKIANDHCFSEKVNKWLIRNGGGQHD
jgi:5'-deoxynucleotidase YfbR-like HD superfamily hydrolase